jgi:pimeloyl-ACP methyl ester carboxylesterase
VKALFCQWLDSWVISSAAARMPKPTGCNPQLDAAEALLAADDFFAPQVASPHLVFGSGDKFEFRSQIQTPFVHNNTVYGRFHRCGADWTSKPTVILLHGWNDDINYRFRFPIFAWQLNRLGMNCIVLTLPYHFQRRPHPPASVRNFISEDILRTVEATRQAIADICSVTKWLVEQGNEQVNLWGISLGAWLAGLTLCHNEMFQSAVLVTPVSRMDRMIAETAFVEPVRRALKGSNVDMTQFNLDTYLPRIPKENILLVEATHDRFVPAETVEDLWHAWGEPEIWRRNLGHVTVMISLGLMKSSAKWLLRRAAAIPASADQR